ncbi:MAG: YraN family protein [Candidatus Omnitrophota bacterium]
MMKDSRLIGIDAESVAVDFLEKQGYKILEKNFRTKLGEIDIIAKDKNTICFVEVKSRANTSRGLPEEAINSFKRRKISRTALAFLKQKNLMDSDARFDVVSIDLNEVKVTLFKNAFELNNKYLY